MDCSGRCTSPASTGRRKDQSSRTTDIRGGLAGPVGVHVAAVYSSTKADGRSQFKQSSVHFKCRPDVAFQAGLGRVFTFAHGFRPNLKMRERAGSSAGQLIHATSSSARVSTRWSWFGSPCHRRQELQNCRRLPSESVDFRTLQVSA